MKEVALAPYIQHRKMMKRSFCMVKNLVWYYRIFNCGEKNGMDLLKGVKGSTKDGEVITLKNSAGEDPSCFA